MAKMTVLAMVQSILNDMDSDEVNSIDDTVEAAQVAQILEDTFYEIINDRVWPTHKTLIQLDATGPTTPSHMRIPSTNSVSEIEWIRYNKIESGGTQDEYEDVIYLEPKDFISKVMGRDSSASNIDTITDPSGLSLYIINDAAPTYYTSFDDDYVVFDSYDSAVDANLQKSKSMTYALVEPSFSKTDAAVPDIPASAFPYFLSEAKSAAFVALKQQSNPKEEQRSRRQRTWLARKKRKVNNGLRYPNYGRK